MKKRCITTLFMMESLDGKISTGSCDSRDVDVDFPKINGVKEGLNQYYELESNTDIFSLNTGRVMSKIGINNRNSYPDKIGVTFVIIDNKPHLDKNGIDYLCHWCSKLIIVTTNKHHISFSLKDSYDNLDILFYENLDLKLMLEDLYTKYNCQSLTIQSGGNMNACFLRNGLIDYVNIVIAPILIGGSDVSTLIDGNGITLDNELGLLKSLELIECNKLDNSYIQLKYKVNN